MSPAFHIWARAVLLILAILILFGAGGFLVDCVRWVLALGRSRIVRVDLRRRGSVSSSDQLLGSRLPRPVGAESVDHGTAAAHVRKGVMPSDYANLHLQVEHGNREHLPGASVGTGGGASVDQHASDLSFDNGMYAAPVHVLPFERRRLTPLEDRWRRLELEGLAMSPFELDGSRRDVR